jgi:hypothetical protein
MRLATFYTFATSDRASSASCDLSAIQPSVYCPFAPDGLTLLQHDRRANPRSLDDCESDIDLFKILNDL